MNAPDPASLPLRDIHLPPPVPWWPLAPGWWVLAGTLAAGALALLGWWWWRRRGRLARAALAELAAVEARYAADGDPHACAAGLSAWRRAAPCSAEAAVTGADWLAALERLAGTPAPPALGTVLMRAAYSPAAAATLDPADLEAASRWLAGLFRVTGRQRGPHRA
ncbi:MAG: DUF4381 family protein [Sinobacteraceae bacterium]|nr:DUF4381 family protein [Nevskiaceae bacterium]